LVREDRLAIRPQPDLDERFLVRGWEMYEPEHTPAQVIPPPPK
jgi:hypothetical protein